MKKNLNGIFTAVLMLLLISSARRIYSVASKL